MKRNLGFGLRVQALAANSILAAYLIWSHPRVSSEGLVSPVRARWHKSGILEHPQTHTSGPVVAVSSAAVSVTGRGSCVRARGSRPYSSPTCPSTPRQARARRRDGIEQHTTERPHIGRSRQRAIREGFGFRVSASASHTLDSCTLCARAAPPPSVSSRIRITSTATIASVSSVTTVGVAGMSSRLVTLGGARACWGVRACEHVLCDDFGRAEFEGRHEALRRHVVQNALGAFACVCTHACMAASQNGTYRHVPLHRLHQRRNVRRSRSEARITPLHHHMPV